LPDNFSVTDVPSSLDFPHNGFLLRDSYAEYGLLTEGTQGVAK
jgi:hypothetical protein